MTATKSDLLLTQSQSPGKPIGDIVWWGLTDALVDEADFRARFAAAGLPETVLPAKRSPHRNLTDAAHVALVGVDGYLVRPIVRAGVFGDVTKLGIVREDRDATADKVIHTQESVITLTTAPHPSDPTVKVVTFAIGTPHPLADKIRAEWERLEGSYTATEIRKAIVNLLGDLAAVTLREHGGVYWVPPQHHSTVEALQRVIGETGHSQFDVLPLFDTSLGTKSVAAAATRSLAEQVGVLLAEAEEFKANAPRSGVLGRRLAEYDDLRKKATLYRDVLSMDVAGLEEAIKGLEATVETMLNAPAATAA